MAIVEMARPGTPIERLKRWKTQRDHGESLDPPPNDDDLRAWRGPSADRDWERLIAFKRGDGWMLLSHRREFVSGDEVKDRMELG